MKTILLLFVFTINIGFAQTQVEGILASFPNTKFSIKIDQSSLNAYRGEVVASGVTDEKGQFNVPVNIIREQPILLFIGNLFFTIWAKPNGTVGIIKNHDASYSFTGTSTIENKILYQSGLMQPYGTTAHIGLDEFKPARQMAYLDSIENRRMQICEAVQSSVSATFQAYYSAEIKSYTVFNKNQYTAMLKTTQKISDQDIPKGYFKFWDAFSLAEDSTASSTYQQALQNYIEYLGLQKVGAKNIGTAQAWKQMFLIADSLLADYPLSLQKQKTDFLLLLIKYFNFDHLTATELGTYKKQFPQSPSLVELENLWSHKQSLASATPSFQLKNLEGETVDIKDFIGKVVYIDFWGSWCKACMLAMPHAEKLKARFQNKDVVFLYLNFFDPLEKWTNAINKYKIEGIHLRAEKTDEAYFDKVFNINQGFPRYALIDKQGKLVSISAPPPQDASTITFIEKYLNM